MIKAKLVDGQRDGMTITLSSHNPFILVPVYEDSMIKNCKYEFSGTENGVYLYNHYEDKCELFREELY